MTTTPGAKTTEFLGLAVGSLTSIGAALSTSSETVQVAAIASFTLIVCTYIWSRTKIKAGK